MFVPQESGLIPTLLQEFHSTPIAGHSGIKATLARLSASFYWPGMHDDVKGFILQCAICQHNKYNTHSPYGILQPLAIPNQVWEEISIDFITNDKRLNANNKRLNARLSTHSLYVVPHCQLFITYRLFIGSHVLNNNYTMLLSYHRHDSVF